MRNNKLRQQRVSRSDDEKKTKNEQKFEYEFGAIRVQHMKMASNWIAQDEVPVRTTLWRVTQEQQK